MSYVCMYDILKYFHNYYSTSIVLVLAASKFTVDTVQRSTYVILTVTYEYVVLYCRV